MYRSPRVFQRQYHLLLTTSLLERAERELASADRERKGRRRRKLQRETERLWDVVEETRRQLVEPEWWRLGVDDAPYRHIAQPELIHPRLRVYVAPGAAAVETDTPESGSHLVRRGVEQLAAAGAVISVCATILQIAVHGLHNRPALIASELATLVFAPIAVWLSAEWSRRRD